MQLGSWKAPRRSPVEGNVQLVEAESPALDDNRAGSSETQSPSLKETAWTPPARCCHERSGSEARPEPWGPGCQCRRELAPDWGPEDAA